jgi:hypothetical protein
MQYHERETEKVTNMYLLLVTEGQFSGCSNPCSYNPRTYHLVSYVLHHVMKERVKNKGNLI